MSTSVGAGADQHVLDQVDPLAEVVEGGDVAGQRHDGVGQAGVGGRDVGEPLDLPHDVVAQPADDPAVEGRQVGQPGRPEPGQQRLEGAEGAPVVGQAGGQGFAC